MKHSLENFTKEEMDYICRLITPKKIRMYFQKKPKEFTAIYRGFRAEKLSDSDTISCVYKNIRQQFIVSFIEKNIEQWLKEIRVSIEEHEKQGISKSEALLLTLSQSVFSRNIDLFFKCTDENFSSDYVSIIKIALQYLEQKKNIDVLANTDTNNLEINEKRGELISQKDKIAELSKTASELQKKLNLNEKIYAETAELLKNITVEKEQLQIKLADANEQIHVARSKLSAMSDELEHFYQLAKFSDVKAFALDDSEYRFTSVCQVRINSVGKLRLTRIADIKNGELVRFMQNEDAPKYFENRDWLFWRDGPSEEGAIGVWNWDVGFNRNDSTTDYVISRYNEHIIITEIKEILTCDCIDELAHYISDNTIEMFSKVKVFFAFRDADYMLNGLLCSEQDFEVSNDKLKLKKSIYMLPQFLIPESDILKIGEKKYYKYMSFGMPQKIYPIKNPIEAVKEFVLARATNAVLRQLGLNTKETQHCRNFLKGLPVDTLYQEISGAYVCSEDEAKKYVSDFILQAESYLSEKDIETLVLAKAIERNEELVARCKELLTVEWEKDYSERLQTAEHHMQDMDASIACKKEELEKSRINYRELKNKLQLIQTEISEKETLACEVEQKVAGRIALARKNAADFICDMAFTLPGHITSQQQSTMIPKGTYRKINSVPEEEISDIDTFEEELAENLELSGYKELVAAEMAQIIVFCISNQLPLVINENAERIADCISAMFGNEGAYAVTFPLGETDCSKICSLIASEAVREYNVFLINGVFDGFTLNTYTELLQHSMEWGDNALLILPLNGISIEMIPSSVWNQAMFIDGDIGVDTFPTSELHAFTTKVIFKAEVDDKILRDKRKLLKQFSGIISNTALLNYSKFLAMMNETIESSIMLRLQISAYAKTTGKTDAFIEAFTAMGIDVKENKELSKYM